MKLKRQRIDLKPEEVLKHIEQNPGQTVTEIGEHFGVNHHAIEKRIKPAREDGSIVGVRLTGQAFHFYAKGQEPIGSTQAQPKKSRKPRRTEKKSAAAENQPTGETLTVSGRNGTAALLMAFASGAPDDHADDVLVNIAYDLMRERLEGRRETGAGGWHNQPGMNNELLEMLSRSLNDGDLVDVILYAGMAKIRELIYGTEA